MVHRTLTCLAWTGLALLFVVGAILLAVETPFIPFEYIFFGGDKLYFMHGLCDWSYNKLANLKF